MAAKQEEIQDEENQDEESEAEITQKGLDGQREEGRTCDFD
jgi:hypothetical protein